MPGPTIRVPLSAEALQKAGRLKEALRAARREERQLSKEINRTIRKGQVADRATVRRFEQTKTLSAKLNAGIKREQQLTTQIRQRIGGQSKTLAAAEGVQGIFRGNLAQRITRGEKLTGDDLFFAFATLQQPLATPIKNIADKFKLTRGVATGLSRITPALPIIAAAVSSTFEAIARRKAEVATAQNVGQLFAAGKISKEEFEFFQRRASSKFFIGNPGKSFSDAQKAGEILAIQGALKQDQIEKLFKNAPKLFGNNTERRSFSGFNEALKINIEKLESRLGRVLNPKEQKRIARQTFADFFSLSDTGELQDFVEKVLKANQTAISTKAERTQTVSQVFRKREFEKQQEIQFQISRRRSPPASIPVEFKD